MKIGDQTGGPGGLPVVTILMKNLNQYRLPFYELLRIQLAESGVELRLVSADGLSEDTAKGDSGTLEWAEHRPFREIEIRGKTLLWQPGFDLAAESDLIITEQASKQLFNIFLAYGQPLFRARHAFWGHGKNFQVSEEGESGEGLKRRLTEKAHWFFSYNDLSTRAAIEAGMPPTRITPVMNSTDTEDIRTKVAALDAKAVRKEFGLGGGPVGLFMGGLYPYKKPEFLVEAAIEIRERIPDFEMVVIGDGSLGHILSEASKAHEWIHWLGAMYGDERLAPASVCSLQLMPGLIGLNIVDGFALGLPTVAIDDDLHSPEIDYLQHDVNGVILPRNTNPEGYAQAVVELLNDKERLRSLQDGADLWGHKLSTQDMVRRFVEGVHAALAAGPR